MNGMNMETNVCSLCLFLSLLDLAGDEGTNPLSQAL
jgi:hypothetical protein